MVDKTNSPDEVLDLVDENDQVVGEVTRKEAHNNPKLIHREISVIIYDDNNRVLLQKRSKKKLVRPGIWSIGCAGHVPKGSDPLVTAHRELKEELGFDTDLVFLIKKLNKRTNETRFIYWYAGKFPGGKIKVDPSETDEAKFFSKNDIDDLSKSDAGYGERSVSMVKKYLEDKL